MTGVQGVRGPTVSESDRLAAANEISWDARPALISYWGADMCNVVASGAFVEFLGVRPEELHGRHVSEVLDAELYRLNRPLIERALAG